MCRTADAPDGFRWQKEPPTEPGDYLWLCQWGCGCVRDSGICWATSEHSEDGAIKIFWEAHTPGGWSGDLADIDWWARLDLPPSPDELERRTRTEQA